MDGGNGCIFKRAGFDSGQVQVMSQITMHSFQVESFQVASGNNP
jgi:hypothetical protein